MKHHRVVQSLATFVGAALVASCGSTAAPPPAATPTPTIVSADTIITQVAQGKLKPVKGFKPLHYDAKTGKFEPGTPNPADEPPTSLPATLEPAAPAGLHTAFTMTGAVGSAMLPKGPADGLKSRMFTTGGVWAVSYSFDCSQNPVGHHGFLTGVVMTQDSANSGPAGLFSSSTNPVRSGHGAAAFHSTGTYYVQVLTPCAFSVSILEPASHRSFVPPTPSGSTAVPTYLTGPNVQAFSQELDAAMAQEAVAQADVQRADYSNGSAGIPVLQDAYNHAYKATDMFLKGTAVGPYDDVAATVAEILSDEQDATSSMLTDFGAPAEQTDLHRVQHDHQQLVSIQAELARRMGKG